MRPSDEDLIKLLCDLVAIDSTNPGLVPGAAGEEALVRFLARRLSAAGLAVDVWEPRPGRPNFVATLPGHGHNGGHAAGAPADARRDDAGETGDAPHPHAGQPPRRGRRRPRDVHPAACATAACTAAAATT